MLDTIKEALINLVPFVVALTMVLLANLGTGVYTSWIEGKFNWKKLLQGVVGYIVYVLGFTLIATAAKIYGGDIQVTIEGTEITINVLLLSVQTTAYGIYVVKFVQNVLEMIQVKKTIKVKDVEYTSTINQSTSNSEEGVSNDDDTLVG